LFWGVAADEVSETADEDEFAAGGGLAGATVWVVVCVSITAPKVGGSWISSSAKVKPKGVAIKDKQSEVAKKKRLLTIIRKIPFLKAKELPNG